MKKSIIIIAAICIANFVFAQDIIIKRNNDSLKVKVTEVSIDEIKFHFYNEPNGANYSIEKAEVAIIRFESGRVEVFETNILVPLPLKMQTKQAIKINFVSPIWGYTKLCYEKLLKPGQSIEVSTTFIGLGKERIGNPRGAAASFAYKFINTPNYYTRGMRNTHQMQGLYVAPTLQIGSFNSDLVGFNRIFNSEPVGRTSTTYVTGMLFVGSQSVFGNHFLIDVNAGIGVGGMSGEERFALMGMVSAGNFFFSSNLKIGYLF